MTAAATERIVNRLRLVPDDREPVIMNFIASIESSDPMDTEVTDRKDRSDAFLGSFMNVEIDEQAIADFRERGLDTMRKQEESAKLTKEQKKERFLQSAGKIDVDEDAVRKLREGCMI